ncbi:MAG: BatA domain-containing protein [Candidatus Wallbacteria bacterium]|nr:BatA domain-containing protein [Candidatus Wallbacteria bacterium]
MSFEYSAFLAGFLSVAVPLILHLWPRIKPKILEFSSLRFFRASFIRLRRRLLFYNILKLILRAAFLSLLAMAFAGPYLAELKQNKKIEDTGMLTSFKLKPEIPFAHLPVELCFDFSNHPPLEISLFINHRDRLKQSLAKSQNQAVFSYTFDTSGDVPLEISVSGRGLEQEYLSRIHVSAQKNILLLTGNDGALEQAFGSFCESLGENLAVVSRGKIDLLERGSLAGYDMVILTCADQIEMSYYRLLEQYLSEGGVVWLFFSKDASVDYLNKMLFNFNENFHGFLPGEITGIAEEEKSPASVSYSDLLNQNREMLTNLVFYKRFSIKPEPSANPLLLTGEQEMLVGEKKFGKGEVVTFLFPFDPDSTNLWRTQTITPFFIDLFLHSFPACSCPLEARQEKKEADVTIPRLNLSLPFLYLALLFFLLEGFFGRAKV